ncbi:DUF4429 domain-containing protein [Streptosporangium sp. NPDC051022]|uniref:DUF4429 domain-containing protein n=1 Tax=Streptosporangium sp. NPDC051022 TaxID=3155752 RepID=UPI00342E4B10
MRANGYLGGYVEFDGQFVTIAHRGATRLLVGSGAKRVHVSEVTAVRIKRAGRLFNGYIRFTVPGSLGRSRPQKGYESATDENTVVYTRSHQ